MRDAVAAARRDWQSLYESTLAEAIRRREISAEVTAADLAFELDAISRTAAQDALLFGSPSMYDRARRILRARLLAVSTDSAPVIG